MGEPAPAPVRGDPPQARLGWAVPGYAIALGALALLVGWPLVELTKTAAADGASGVHAALSSSGHAVLNTVWTSVAITAVAVVGGTLAALVTERSAAPGRRGLRFAMIASLVSAPLVSALGWTRSYGRAGITDQLLGLHWDGLYGPAGIVVVGSAGAVPLAYLLVAAALASRVEPDLELAARASGASPAEVVRTVTLPLARRAIGAAAALVFVSAVNGFEIPAVLGIPAGFSTMTTQLYENLTLSADPAAFTAATVLAIALVVVAVAVVGPADVLTGAGAVRRTGGSSGTQTPPRSGSWWLTSAVWAFLLVTVAVPLVSLVLVSLTRAVGLDPVPANWSLANFRAATGGPFARALGNSLRLAIGAATVVVLLGGLTAALGRSRRGGAIGTAVTLTFAVSGSALAVAVLLAYGRFFRDTLTIILIAYVAKFWALGHRPLAGAVDRVPDDLVRAGRSSGAGPAVLLRTVVAPLLRPALAAGWLLVFLFCIHELTISSLLYGPDKQTLAVLVLNQQQLGDVGVSSALSVLLTLLIAAAAALLLLARRAAGQVTGT